MASRAAPRRPCTRMADGAYGVVLGGPTRDRDGPAMDGEGFLCSARRAAAALAGPRIGAGTCRTPHRSRTRSHRSRTRPRRGGASPPGEDEVAPAPELHPRLGARPGARTGAGPSSWRKTVHPRRRCCRAGEGPRASAGTAAQVVLAPAPELRPGWPAGEEEAGSPGLRGGTCALREESHRRKDSPRTRKEEKKRTGKCTISGRWVIISPKIS